MKWSSGKEYGAVVSDVPIPGLYGGADDTEAYGGYLVCESTAKSAVPYIVAAPKLVALGRTLIANQDAVLRTLPPKEMTERFVEAWLEFVEVVQSIPEIGAQS